LPPCPWPDSLTECPRNRVRFRLFPVLIAPAGVARHGARTVYGWLTRGKGLLVDAGMISAAAMSAASGLQHGVCAPG
jgi:hypothetical protein